MCGGNSGLVLTSPGGGEAPRPGETTRHVTSPRARQDAQSWASVSGPAPMKVVEEEQLALEEHSRRRGALKSRRGFTPAVPPEARPRSGRHVPFEKAGKSPRRAPSVVGLPSNRFSARSRNRRGTCGVSAARRTRTQRGRHLPCVPGISPGNSAAASRTPSKALSDDAPVITVTAPLRRTSHRRSLVTGACMTEAAHSRRRAHALGRGSVTAVRREVDGARLAETGAHPATSRASALEK